MYSINRLQRTKGGGVKRILTHLPQSFTKKS